MLCMVQDPSVMSAALCALLEVVTVDPKPYKNLIPSFISILKQVKFSRHHCRNSGWKSIIECSADIVRKLQVAEHRLPKSYDYHRTPAPFIQVRPA